ncbi:DUF6541 family protein [Chloroflexus sp.]|uniref:DUF6541 family protein n=1 Tax=Chloroflexus sp. TaxID=1904827 RepID=UPI00261E06CE|nr:DUF6541 family protein [uncultured Chloroflexus sp.]
MIVSAKHRNLSPALWLATIWLAAVLSMAAPGLLWWASQMIVVELLTALGGALLFIVPGLAVLRWLHPEPLPWFERLIYAAGLSWAVIPLLMLVSEPIGWRWNGTLAWFALVLLAALALWPARRLRRSRLPYRDMLGWSLALVTIAVFATRFFPTRDLPLGLFGDSYHHTVITQLMIDNGGLFHSWQPYAPAVTFTYHYAFHAMAAWWRWLSGVSAPQAVILTGQAMNGLAAPLLYLLTARLTGSRLTGVWAAVIVGFLSWYPAYYVNWGRYTQLAGQTVLPVAAVAWMSLIDTAIRSQRSLLRPLLLAIITSAGLAVSHYRVAILAICFVIAYGAVSLAPLWGQGRRQWLRFVFASFVGAVGAGLLALPWLWRVQQGQIIRMASSILGTDVEARNPIALEIVGLAFQAGLFPLAAVGLGFLLWQRRPAGVVLALWATLSWLAANPQLLNLNGQGLITSFAVLIGAYLAIAPAAGAGVHALARVVTAFMFRSRSAAIGFHLALGLLMIGWGARMQVAIIDPAYQLATPADVQAAAWIDQHLPPDAVIFVNSFPAYGGYVYAGTDGGWWLSFLTGRRANLLPMAVGFEATDPPDLLQIIRQQHEAIQQYPIGSVEAAAALKSFGFEYLYDGPAANPPGEYLNPAQIDAAPFYELIYRQDGVSIWRIR